MKVNFTFNLLFEVFGRRERYFFEENMDIMKKVLKESKFCFLAYVYFILYNILFW